MTKSKIFILISLSFAFGIFFASKFNVYGLWALWTVGAGSLAFAASLTIKNIYFRRSAQILVLFLFFAGLGVLRFNQTLADNAYKNFFGQKVKWEGYVMEDPDVRSDKQLLTVQPINFDQRVLVTTTRAQSFFYGDWLLVEGKLKQPEDFEGFDYSGYLERFGIYGIMSYPKILILKNGQANIFKSALLTIKHAFAKRLQKFLPEPQNSLALGILIGAKRGLPQNLTDSFNNTGTSHIVAISGFNIAIIVAALSFLAWIVGRKMSFWLSLIIILGFVVIAGASASVIRAAVMGILLLMAFNIGRLYSVMPALIFAAAGMLYVNPKILYWDIGFQLSFAATLGLVLFMPLLEKLAESWPKMFGLKLIFLATLAATVSTLPLVLWYFGRLSLVSLLANLLVLPVVPFAMLFGFLTVLPFFGPGFAFLANALLTYILWVVETLARWPLANVSAEISKKVLLSMIAALFVLYFLLRKIAGKLRRVEIIKPL